MITILLTIQISLLFSQLFCLVKLIKTDNPNWMLGSVGLLPFILILMVLIHAGG